LNSIKCIQNNNFIQLTKAKIFFWWDPVWSHGSIGHKSFICAWTVESL